MEAYTEAIAAARVAAERDLGVVLRWMYDIPGESGLVSAHTALSYVLHNRPEALVRFGLAGPEMGRRVHETSAVQEPRLLAHLAAPPGGDHVVRDGISAGLR